MSYSIIGDDQAPGFFAINSRTGNITLSRDLKTDNAEFYTLRVTAQDQGDPPKSATNLVKIEVLRNFYTPRFVPVNYTVTILETLGLGLPIIQVNATDADRMVSIEKVNTVLFIDGTMIDPYVLSI